MEERFTQGSARIPVQRTMIFWSDDIAPAL
jgi:hypothetical protein